MAVTLLVDDLTQPEGELDNSFFPDGDLDAKLDGWIDRAAGRVESNGNISVANQNSAAATLIYHYAYSYIASRIASMPNTAAVNGGDVSVSYAVDRINYWQGKADAKLASYDVLAVTPPTVTVTNNPPSYTGVPVNAIW